MRQRVTNCIIFDTLCTFYIAYAKTPGTQNLGCKSNAYTANMQNEKEDVELCRRLKAGEEQALAGLFTKYQPLMLDRAYFYLRNVKQAEDVVQEAFVRIWNHRKKLKEDTMLRAYLLKTVANLSLNKIRHEGVAKTYLDHVAKGADTAVYNFHIEKKELQTQVRNAIAQIPAPANRRALEMLYIEQKSVTEIANETNTNVQVVRNRVYHALKFLRGFVKKDAF